MSYIQYKLYNLFFLSLMSSRVAGLLRTTGVVYQPCTTFYFDLSDQTTHLGDRLFFIPLIKLLNDSGYIVKISSCDSITLNLLESIVKISPVVSERPAPLDCVIFPAPSFLNLKNKYINRLIVDFTDIFCFQKITEQLSVSISKMFDLRLGNPSFVPVLSVDGFLNLHGLKTEQKCFLFNNYIDSGRFRKFFINEKKLFVKARDLKKQGYRIIHVGSKKDVETDSKSYPFIDVDLRGQTSITDLIQMVQSDNIVGAITYDNFLMHLVGMYGKVAFVLFRGRLSRKNREHHMLHVNNTFFDQKDNLIYL